MHKATRIQVDSFFIRVVINVRHKDIAKVIILNFVDLKFILIINFQDNQIRCGILISPLKTVLN